MSTEPSNTPWWITPGPAGIDLTAGLLPGEWLRVAFFDPAQAGRDKAVHGLMLPAYTDYQRRMIVAQLTSLAGQIEMGVS
jgi:hypothetical protein